MIDFQSIYSNRGLYLFFSLTFDVERDGPTMDPEKKKKVMHRWFWPSTTIQLIALAIDRLETALFLSTQCLHYIEEQGSFALISSY